MTLKFKPEDFKWDLQDNCFLRSYKAAEYAQTLFDKWLKSQKVVYASNKSMWLCYWDVIAPEKDRTHKAYLVNPQPIKQECEHEGEYYTRLEPLGLTDQIGVFGYKCKKCPAKLQPTGWEEVK